MVAYKNMLFLILVSALSVAACYYNPFNFYFLNDDFIHIQLSSKGEILQHAFFRPICDLSVRLDHFIWGKAAWGYHLSNLGLHILSTTLFFFLCKLVLERYEIVKNAGQLSAVSATLFFIYAMHSEAVFWVLGRSAILGALFFIPSIYLYLKRHSLTSFLYSLAFMIIGWMTYESTWICPIFVILISGIDVLLKRTVFKKEVVYIGIVWLLFVIYLAARYYFTNQFLTSYVTQSLEPMSLIDWGGHLFKFAVRSFLPPMQNSMLLIFIFILLLSAMAALIYFTKERRTNYFLGLLLISWLIALTPVVSLGIDTKGTESERYLYLPTLFVCLFIVILIYRISNSVVRLGVIMVVMAFHLFFLYKSMVNYKFAGEVTKATIREIETLTNSGTLYVSCLPEEHYGALIFRTGFIEAVEWMKQTGAIGEVKIISIQAKDQEYLSNYSAWKVFSLEEALPEIILPLIDERDPQFKENVYFNYTPTGLKVFNSK